ncbi:hypothetical protein H4Q26_001155 [Puccinia striiformis f. sp. tritici PST-130]|nr:hypothetical protein H4Q26_001155 [Puccinia striiformis f. sp. tritici PST-130]
MRSEKFDQEEYVIVDVGTPSTKSDAEEALATDHGSIEENLVLVNTTNVEPDAVIEPNTSQFEEDADIKPDIKLDVLSAPRENDRFGDNEHLKFFPDLTNTKIFQGYVLVNTANVKPDIVTEANSALKSEEDVDIKPDIKLNVVSPPSSHQEIHALKKQIVFETLILREAKSEEEIENSLNDLKNQLFALTHQPIPNTEVEMAKSPEETLAELQQEMNPVNAKIAMFEATSATTPQPVPQAIPNATQAIVLNNLMKSITNIHREGNARKVVLDNHGTNYKQWEVSIDHTLMHAFCVDKIFVNNKGCWSSLASQQAARSKIELATTLLNLANDASPSDEFTIAKWSKDLSALTKLKVTTNELVASCSRTPFAHLLAPT